MEGATWGSIGITRRKTMGFFGPSAAEEATFRRMDHLLPRSATLYTEAMLKDKERKLEAIIATINPDSAQRKWIKQVRQAIAYRREQIKRERQLSTSGRPPVGFPFAVGD
jgi:hypothetical protein